MSRLSIRPRPLDIHKKLPIVKSVQEFEDDESGPTTNFFAGASARNLHVFFSRSSELESEGHSTPSKKNPQEIPTPQYNVVESYERTYTRTFAQPTSYLRSRGARTEIGEFIEYDLDNEDEDWLEEFNNDRKILTSDKFEIILFKLEVLDHKMRERAGVITPTFGSPIPTLLQLDDAAETLQSLYIKLTVLKSVYNYWRAKRKRWQKPILRCLQPPPPVTDTNPYNVFRPREKAHRLHTRRMQRRENNVHSFEKLRQVRRNLDQAKTVLDALIKREEKKREAMECEVSLQRIQIKYKNDAQLVEHGVAIPSFQALSYKFSSSGDIINSDNITNDHIQARRATVHHMRFGDSKPVLGPTIRMKQDLKQRYLSNGWLHQDPLSPILLFTRPLEPDKLAKAGIVPPPDPPPIENGPVDPPQYRFRGRMGRGGRIVFDRWNPFI